MKLVLSTMYDDNNPKDLADKIAVSLLYYGLLRKTESITIELKDVKVNSDVVDINYPYPTKRTARGFSFKIPSFLVKTFELYISQMPENADPSSRFLKNWSKSKDGRGRIQNYGPNKLSALPKRIQKFLGKEGNYTPHTFRRSGATALAEAGISIVALCHAGRWSNLKTAQEYQEHSELQKTERVNLLENPCGTPEQPNKKYKVSTAAGNAPHTVGGDYVVVNITGEAKGSYSFWSNQAKRGELSVEKKSRE